MSAAVSSCGSECSNALRPSCVAGTLKLTRSSGHFAHTREAWRQLAAPYEPTWSCRFSTSPPLHTLPPSRYCRRANFRSRSLNNSLSLAEFNHLLILYLNYKINYYLIFRSRTRTLDFFLRRHNATQLGACGVRACGLTCTCTPLFDEFDDCKCCTSMIMITNCEERLVARV